jgi:Tfp pilus assembly protein PilO
VKASDRTVLIVLVLLGALAALWFLMLAPKRQEASKLDAQIAELESEVSVQEALVEEGRLAQADYERNFSALVVLGKAAPADGDTPAMLEQLVAISKKAKTDFELLQQGQAAEVQEPPAAETTTDANAETPPSEGETPPAEGTTATEAAAPVSAVPATEGSVATVPLGATVGSAGLNVLPYDVKFTGSFFEVADLFKGIDEMVGSRAAEVEVSGRLVTVNSFTMVKPDDLDFLEVELSMTTYVLPGSQGLTAGGTSTAPPASVPASTPVAGATP